jgi:hypothetical protein
MHISSVVACWNYAQVTGGQSVESWFRHNFLLFHTDVLFYLLQEITVADLYISEDPLPYIIV